MPAAHSVFKGKIQKACLPANRSSRQYSRSLAICRPSGCTVVSGFVVVVVVIVVVVVVVVVVVFGVCNCSQMRTGKCSCLIFGVRIGLDAG